MKPSIKFKRTTLFLILLVLGCFTISPIAQAGGQSRPSPTPTPTTQDVNVVNTPNVSVVNTTASPVQVRDVDNPARQPFHAQVMGGFADGASTTGDIILTTVPDGKQLVIEYVSIFGAMITGQQMIDASVKFHSGFYDEYDFHHLMNESRTNVAGTLDYFVASGPVRFYSGPGPVYCFAERNSTTGANPNSVTFTVSGYFVDCPTCQ